MGRASMRSTLANVAAMLGATIEACPWHALRFAHVAPCRVSAGFTATGRHRRMAVPIRHP